VNQRIYRARISKTRTMTKCSVSCGGWMKSSRAVIRTRIRAEITRQVSATTRIAGCLNGRPTASGRAGLSADCADWCRVENPVASRRRPGNRRGLARSPNTRRSGSEEDGRGARVARLQFAAMTNTPAQ